MIYIFIKLMCNIIKLLGHLIHSCSIGRRVITTSPCTPASIKAFHIASARSLLCKMQKPFQGFLPHMSFKTSSGTNLWRGWSLLAITKERRICFDEKPRIQTSWASASWSWKLATKPVNPQQMCGKASINTSLATALPLQVNRLLPRHNSL